MLRSICLFLLTMICVSPQAAAQDVVFTVDHSVSALGKRGYIEFKIDTSRKKGPFLVRMTYPDGKIDTIVDLTEPVYTYNNLLPGLYCIDIQCCAVCSAAGCMEVLNYEHRLVGETSVFLTREKTPPGTDSTAILLACVGVEEDSSVLCSATFSWYAPVELSTDQIGSMLENALACMYDIRVSGYSDYQENGPDTWLPGPFMFLFRFDVAGRILWVSDDR